MTNKIILIAGPTASGKSNLAIKIANKINGEIINADSMQVYKEFSVLSSRPTKSDLIKAKHHLYGFWPAKKHFSTGSWLKLAKKKIKECIKKNKVPIIVGGTGLYFKAITEGISKIPFIGNKKRTAVRKLHKKIGQIKFYKKLILIDPMAQKNISPKDTHRTMRAYEVKLYTKKSLYEWSTKTKSEFLDYDIKKFFINTPREIILENIEKRTNQMFENNCIKEVMNFLKLKSDKSLSPHKLIGVKEISDYLSGTLSLKEAKQLIKIKTRQYAKRQNTWSRGHMKNWNKLYFKGLPILANKILKAIS